MSRTTTEVLAKLGIDTKDIPKDLNDAKKLLGKFQSDVEKDSAKSGTGSGAKFMKGFSAQIVGQARGAFAALLGLNAQSIADKIAEVVTGGSKEAWEEFGRISDENSRAIGEKIRANLDASKVVANLTRDLEAANKKVESTQAAANGGAAAGGGPASMLDAMKSSLKSLVGLGKDEVDVRLEAVKAQAEQLRIQKELEAAQKTQTAMQMSLVSAQRDYAFATADTAGKRKILEQEVADIQDEIRVGLASEADLYKAKIELLNKDLELREVIKTQAQETADIEEKAANKRKKALDDETKKQKALKGLTAKQGAIEATGAALQAKLADRSKLTVGELAAVRGNDFGVSVDVGNAQRRAAEIQELEKDAESRRITGDMAGSEDALARATGIRKDLVESGFLKSTETGEDAIVSQLKENQDDSRENLAEIKDVLKGKFLNE